MTQVHTSKFEFVEKDGKIVDGFRHTNPDGTLGGWVAANAIIEKGAYVEIGAVVPPGTHVTSSERVLAEEVISIEPL